MVYFPADDNDLPQRVEAINVEWVCVCPVAALVRRETAADRKLRGLFIHDESKVRLVDMRGTESVWKYEPMLIDFILLPVNCR